MGGRRPREVEFMASRKRQIVAAALGGLAGYGLHLACNITGPS